MTTTASDIRDAMLALVESMTPAVESGTKFRRYREQSGGFRAWAESNPQAALRRFSIRYLGDFAPSAVNNIVVSETSDTFEIVIAYQSSHRFGGAHDLDDVIASDQRQIHSIIGPPGYASLTAPATVMHEDNWSRDESGTVVFAIVRYRVDFYTATGAVNQSVRVSGTGGSLLKSGAVVTGSAVRDVVVDNGMVKLTYEFKTPANAEMLAHTLYAYQDGVATRVVSTQHGDWSYFVVGPTVSYDRVTVVEASADAVELVFQCDAYSLTSYAGGGVPSLDDAGAFNYAQGAVNPNWKLHTTIKLTKSIRMERGVPGYFVGWHSSPRIGPAYSQLPTLNYYTGFGERELGLGGNTAVAFSSAGRTSRHPAWGAKSEWNATGLATNVNRPAWMGIDDPFESPWNGSSFIATQESGFPSDQTTAPYWVGDIDADPVAVPFVRYVAMRERLEVGVWQFDVVHRGCVVVHFVNEYHSPAGVPWRHMVFIGAVPYKADSSSAFINEPNADLRNQIATLAAGLDWPAT